VERRGAPPTSIATARQFLDLIDLYAAGREFFDDEMSNRALIELRRFVIGHALLLYNGHSTGGLTGSLYADARRDVGTIDAIFLNSPFFDMNASWLAENALIPLAAALGKLRPDVEIPSTIPRLWGESIHRVRPVQRALNGYVPGCSSRKARVTVANSGDSSRL
jgi:alpha-beta hydrolase superfamily lysophospholipase